MPRFFAVKKLDLSQVLFVFFWKRIDIGFSKSIGQVELLQRLWLVTLFLVKLFL